MILLLYLL